MDKNKKNSLLLIVVIIAIFVLAYVFYSALSQNSPDNSYTPTIVTDISDSNLVQPEAVLEPPVDETIEVSNPENEDEQVLKDEKNEAITEEETEQSTESMIMPNIPITLMNGQESTFWEVVELGKPVVINSFASWCPPCKSEMPHFIEASEDYKNEVTFIFFDSFDGERENDSTLQAFAEEYFNEDTIVVKDPGYISYLFQSNSLPTTILLDKEGIPVNGFQGMISKEALIEAVEQLL